jgi:hypothetical protein
MKKLLLFLLVITLVQIAHTDETTNKKTYEVRFVEKAPYGVTVWAQSNIVKDAKSKETRFVDYNSDAAKGLALDATAERDTEKSATAATRETAFYSVYDDKGWYLYIRAQEPLVQEILDNVLDMRSPARREAYEIFFVPGLHNAPYYQIFSYSFTGVTNFYDWGVPHRHYRSLKEYAKVETLPLEDGFGTFVFIPWEALYDYLPLNGEYWRFSIIRWMPFGKAGGVTWGGHVHDTGNFGLLHFEKPTAAQQTAIEKRMLRVAWFKFLATSKAAATFWSDEKIGDPEFYNGVLKPVIDEYAALGESLGKPDAWNAATLSKAAAVRDDWMEFDYKVSELREEYLLKKSLEEPHA